MIARGRAELLPFDVARGRCKLSRYLGQDEARRDRRFRHYLRDNPADTGTCGCDYVLISWLHKT